MMRTFISRPVWLLLMVVVAMALCQTAVLQDETTPKFPASVERMKCTNDICDRNVQVVATGTIGTYALTPRGFSGGGAEAYVNGPAMITVENVNPDCDCQVKFSVSAMDFTCNDAPQVINIPDKGVNVRFIDIKDKGCMQFFFRISPTLADTAKILQDKLNLPQVLRDEILKTIQVGPLPAKSGHVPVNFGIKPVEQPSVAPKLLQTAAAAKSCVAEYTLDLQVVHHIEGRRSRQMQLMMHKLSGIFAELNVGMAHFGDGAGSCYEKIGPIEFGPYALVKIQLRDSAEIHSVAGGPVSEGRFALLKAAEETNWTVVTTNDSQMIRIIILDVSEGEPYDVSTSCGSVNDEEVVEALRSRSISVVFLTKAENEDAWRQFQKKNMIAGYVYSATNLASMNKLHAIVEKNMEHVCAAQSRTLSAADDGEDQLDDKDKDIVTFDPNTISMFAPV